jgi:imidazolonepropionase
MRELEEVSGAAIAVDAEGRIIAAGREADVRADVPTDTDTRLHDARGALAVPGFVDCHAHPAFGGDRAAEFELRNLGAAYEQIHAAGGGIRSTVAATRSAIADGTLTARVREHLDWMLVAGTTTAEAKSGYGLSVDAELAGLRAVRDVSADHPVRVTRTLLAAHTVPAEYADRGADAYTDEVAIPAVAAAASENLASAADVFLERGSFSAVQAERYLRAAAAAGLALRLHADQFSDAGALPLALALGARSVDHLEALEPDAPRLRNLAGSGTAGVLLPLSSLFLGRPYAPGRALVDAGGIVALASDFNPGSSYGESLTLAMSLASVGCGLRASEALTAVTANAAWVLGLDHECGRLAPGFSADVVLLDQPSVAHLAYHVGSPAVSAVFARGKLVA